MSFELMTPSWNSHLPAQWVLNYYLLKDWTADISLSFFFFFYKFIYFFFYFWLCWVFVSVRGLSPAVASRGHSSLQCAGLSLSRPLLLQSTGSRRAGSVVVAHRLSCSVACGIFPDQGSNPCPLHWQADSQPLRHQGSPDISLLNAVVNVHLTSSFPDIRCSVCSLLAGPDFCFNGI